MKKLYFWRGALGDQEFLSTHQEALQALIEGTYTAGNLETLKGHRNIFSYRLNRTERLLFTTLDVAGHPYLLLLEHLPTHDYKNSHFLRSGVLKRYLDLHGEELKNSAPTFEPIENIPQALQHIENIDKPPIALDFYKDEFIQLSEVQEEVLKATLPVVISGVAGSGKSCVAMSLITDAVKRYLDHPDGKPRKILYVTESARLADSMKNAWSNLPIAQELPKELTVEFKNYLELMQNLDEIHQHRLVDRADFEAGYAEFMKKQQHLAKVTGSKHLDMDAEALYQEFRICSAYSEKAYLALGERQSTLAKGQERQSLYTAYTRYITDLEKTNRLHPAFHRFVKTNDYDLIVMDEAQDLSHLQLQNLATLAKDLQIACCIDSHQSLRDALSKRPYLLEMLKRHERDVVSHIELPVTYRCPVKIARVADVLIQAKYHLTGGAADKKEAPSVLPHIEEGAGFGHALIIDTPTLKTWAWLNQQAQGAHFAVVTLPEFVSEAEQYFQTHRIFTPDQIKGLEYDTVVVFHPFMTQSMKTIAHHLDDFDPSSQKIHRPKKHEGPNAYVTSFNELLTSVTRAKQTLVIYEEKTRNTAPFLNALLAVLGKTSLVEAEHQRATMIDDWKNEIIRQINHGQIERARQMFHIHMGNSDETFETFLEHLQQKETQVPCPKAKTEESNSSKSMPQEKKVASPEKINPLEQEKKIVLPSLSTKATPSIDTKTILDLLKDFTPEHLSLFLKLSDFKSSWYKTPVDYNGRILPLIQHVLFDTHKLQIFIMVLLSNASDKPSSILTLYAKKFMDSITAVEEAGRVFTSLEIKILMGFCFLIEPALLNQKDKHYLLNHAFLSDGTEEYIENTLIFWLVGQEIGVEFIDKLFITQPQLFNSIPADLWLKDRSLANLASPLYYLALSETGQNLMLRLFKSPHFLKHSAPDLAWFLTIKNWSLAWDAHSTLFNLTVSRSGIELLSYLHHKKIIPNFLKNIPVDAWSKQFSISAKDPKKTSAILNLVCSSEGRSLILELFTLKPKLISEIPLSAWIYTSLDSNNALQNQVLYHLSKDPEGLKILNLLLKNKAEFVDLFNNNFLSNPFKSINNTISIPTILFYLSLSVLGQITLNILFEKNPKLMEKIPLHLWIDRGMANNSAFQSATPIYNLSKGPEGVSILEKLLEHQPDSIKLIPSEIWTQTILEPIDGLINTSPLYFLTEKTEGITFLTHLFEVCPTLLTSIPIDSWLEIIKKTSGKSRNKSALSNLSASKEGDVILKLLLEKNPRLKQFMDSNQTTILPSSTTKNANTFFTKNNLEQTPTSSTTASTHLMA